MTSVESYQEVIILLEIEYLPVNCNCALSMPGSDTRRKGNIVPKLEHWTSRCDRKTLIFGNKYRISYPSEAGG